MSEQGTAKRRRHAKAFVVTVDRTPHVPHIFYVIDCACGWQSPLCKTRERASELYEAHRERKAARRSRPASSSPLV